MKNKINDRSKLYSLRKPKKYSHQTIAECPEKQQNRLKELTSLYDQTNIYKRPRVSAKHPKQTISSLVNCSLLELISNKSRKDLLVENSELRRQIETQKSKRSPLKKYRTGFSKKMNTQFEKEMYWQGNKSHMISGVKYQYEKMKDSLEKRNTDFEELVKTKQMTNFMEMVSYLQALQIENHVISSKMESRMLNIPLRELEKLKDSDKDEMILDLQDKIARMDVKSQLIKSKSKKLHEQIKEKNTKIQFLEKLLISKDNNEHIARREAKKVEVEKITLKTRIKQLEQVMKKQKQSAEKESYEIRQHFEKRYCKEIEYMQDIINEKNMDIKKLNKENAYIRALLDCWKQQKYPNEIKFVSQPVQEKVQSVKQQQKRPQPEQLVNQQKEEEVKTSKLEHKMSQEQQRKRVRMIASNKNSQNSVKTRKVDKYHLEPITELVKYQLIANQITLEQFVKRFEFKDNQLTENKEWQKEYINMGDVRKIIKDAANLSNEDEMLLCRYIIEDTQDEYVYADDLNEQSRGIATSIIKSLFEEYKVYKENIQEFQKIAEQNRNKIEFSLQSITKGGVISIDKFRDLLKSLSLQVNGTDQYLIAKMAKFSKDIQKLEFKYLFES